MTDGPIDQTVFSELCDATGADFAAELVNTFAQEAPGMISDLKTAATEGNADAFRRCAHSIKSNADTFGAPGLAELARKMEAEGLTDGSTPEAIGKLETEFFRATDALLRTLDE